MFFSSERLARAGHELLEAQSAFVVSMIDAWTEVGVSATERNVETVKTLLATATVATRQWLTGGLADRDRPLLSALDAGARPPAAGAEGMAPPRFIRRARN